MIDEVVINSHSMRELPVRERPRERLLEYGSAALSSSELLAIILGQGVPGQPVHSLVQCLLQMFGGLEPLSRASAEELLSVRGLGQAKVCQLLASLELARRVHREGLSQRRSRQIVHQPQEIAATIRTMLTNPDQEHFWVVSLSSRNHLLGIDTVSTGTIDASLVHPRETFAAAIRRAAAKIIICHNHPSGDPQPSEDDLLITKRLSTAGKIMGIELLDHVIVTLDDFYSLQRNGNIKV